MTEISSELQEKLLRSLDMRAIAAMGENRVIGKNNSLPWNIPEEMDFFRKTTDNATIFMGRKTFESIGRPLSNRTNIVLTNNPMWEFDGVLAINNVERLFDLNVAFPIWLCGGATLYEVLLPACRELYLSTVFGNFEGEAKFPEFIDFEHKGTILTSVRFKVDHFVNKTFFKKS